MTTTQLTPPDPVPDLPLSRPKTEQKLGPPTSPPPDSKKMAKEELQGTVSSVVDDIVKDAVFEASLSSEKNKVQRLITDLVTRVRHEAATSPTSDESNPATTKAETGVPLSDQRLRRLSLDSAVTWSQTMDYVTINLAVPEWVRKQHVIVTFLPGSVQIKVLTMECDSSHVELGGPLVAQIDIDGCVWSLEGSGTSRLLTIELEKAREQWWARLFMADDPRDYVIAEEHYRAEVAMESLPASTHHHNKSDETEFNRTRDNLEAEKSALEDSEDMPSELGGSAVGKKVVEANSDECLEETVRELVEDVVTSVVGKTPSKGGGVQEAQPSSLDQASKQSGQPQKALTRADLAKMVDQYREAFTKGGSGASEAALQLATFYHHGIGVDQNDANAARLYTYALENGTLDASAAFQLGLIFNQGADGLEPDASEAVRWWQVAARLGNSVAMFNLGVMTMNGSGCDMDPVAALRWFRQAQLLNPQLRPPQFTGAQIEERMVIAAKLKKQRMKRALPPEERARRREEALAKARQIGYASAAIVGLGLSVVVIRHWWRNRL